MEKQYLTIDGIPAILRGPASNKIFIAVHGDQSHKADKVLTVFAEEAMKKGCRTLSFDLPEHGGRKGDLGLCNPQNCVEDLFKVMDYARNIADDIRLFGCSIGAYFGMLAFKNEPLKQALFLSPVVNMKRLIDNIMTWFDISEEKLKREREIVTPVKTLYWNYYKYVLEHPVEWNIPTALLYGEQDDLCDFEGINDFAERVNAEITIFDEGEHYFHTDAQLAFFRQWLQDHSMI